MLSIVTLVRFNGSLNTIVILAFSSFETGQPAFALLVAVLNWSWVAPGTFALTWRWIVVMANPLSSFSRVTVASVEGEGTTFDLRLFYPNIVAGSYTVNCDHVNFAHIPLRAADDPVIWQGIAGAPAQMVSSFPFSFSSPVDHQPFNQGRTVPVNSITSWCSVYSWARIKTLSSMTSMPHPRGMTMHFPCSICSRTCRMMVRTSTSDGVAVIVYSR